MTRDQATGYTLCCGDLTLFARQDLKGWIWVIDGRGVKNVAIASNEGSAKRACISVAKARLRRRGVPIPDSLNEPHWRSERA